MRSAAARYGGEGDHDHHHHHHHHHQQQQDHGGGMIFHVPQHSRREKLRFPPDESPPLIHHDLDESPAFYHPDALSTATFLPLSSPSSCCYYAPNPNPNPKSPTAAAAAASTPIHGYRQPFSLSLSPSSSAHPPAARCHVSGGDGVLPMVNPVPLGPFTGYGAVLNRSRFVEPARMLLEEMCHVVLGPAATAAAVAAAQPLSALRPAMDGPDRSAPSVEQQQRKKMGLLSLLDEVCRRYKLYYQQVQAVITSFESVAGLSTAAPYASTALKVMQKHFTCLKSLISGQLRHMNKVLQDELIGKEESSGFGVGNSDAYLPRTENSSVALRQSNVWRPQRGLPERAVSVLRAWLFEHFLHPYPTDSDKQMLAKHTGLSRNQVSNWFINARVRLWKPMVEEIHSLEMRELHKVAADGRDPIPGDRAQTSNSTLYNNFTQTIGQKNQSPPSKRIRENAVHIPRGVEEPLNFIFDDLSGHHHVAVGGGVSLTLGLQNNGVNLVDPIPSNSIRGFGYEECNDDAYVVGAFGGSDRQFGKDVGGHFFQGFGG